MPDHVTKGRCLQNQQHLCSLPRCDSHRWKLSKFCAKHASAKIFYGDPLGKPVGEREIKEYRKVVRRYLKRHAQHQAVLTAVDAVREIITPPGSKAQPRSKQDGRWYLATFLQRLEDEGAEPMDVLIETSAVWMLSHHEPKRLPDGDPLTWALARPALYCSTMPPLRKRWRFVGLKGTQDGYVRRRPGAGPCRLLGTQLRRTLGVFYVRLAEVLDKEREQEVLKQLERDQRKRALASIGT